MQQHPERVGQIAATLIGEDFQRQRLYTTSAQFKHRIDLLAHLVAGLVEDAALAATVTEAEALERLAKAERSTAMYLVRGDEVKPICGAQSPTLLVGGEEDRQRCQLEPHHPGPHRSQNGFYPGGHPMTWLSDEREG